MALPLVPMLASLYHQNVFLRKTSPYLVVKSRTGTLWPKGNLLYLGLPDDLSARNYTVYSTTEPGIWMVYSIIRATQMVYKTQSKWITIKQYEKLQWFTQTTRDNTDRVVRSMKPLSTQSTNKMQQLLKFITCRLTLRWLMSYIYGAPVLDVSRSHTTTQHSR